MLVRLLAIATACALSLLIVMWLSTGERIWLRRAWLVFRIALCAVVAILLLFLGQAALQG